MSLKRYISFLFLLIAYHISIGQIGFIENKGQYDEAIHYQAEFNTHTIYLDKEGFSVLLHDEKKWSEIVSDFHDDKLHKHDSHSSKGPLSLNYQYIKYEFVGADLSLHTGTKTTSEYYNFFIGNDKSKWAGGVKKHTKVLFVNIYPNIDLEFETIDERFKYNFILKPGADIKDILVSIQGADDIRVTDDRVYVDTRFGEYSEVMPISYEVEGGVSTQIKMKYVKRGEFIGFETPFFKNKVKTVIDPEVIFATYSGSSVDNFGFTATFDDDGNLYAGGIATSPVRFNSGRYPATPGAFQVTYNGGDENNLTSLPCDMSISKYTKMGNQLIYATYLGGGTNEFPHSLIIDNDGQLIVFGTSSSTNYPTTLGAIQGTKKESLDVFQKNAYDLVLTKFNSTGTGLIGSTYLGGTEDDGLNSNKNTSYFYADDFRGEVNLDKDDNIYVASVTVSNNFPTRNGFQNFNAGNQDGVVFSTNSTLTNLRWSTYLGGTGDDAAYSIDIAKNGEVVVAGGTSSKFLPQSSGGFRDSTYGGVDGFVSKLSGDGTSVLQSTFFGTTSYDQILFAELDIEDNIYVVGHSRGDLPVKGAVYSNLKGKQFVSKLSNDLRNLELSTVYGSGGNIPDITINAFLVDECGKVYASGWGSDDVGASSWRLVDMPLTDNAFQSTTDGKDFHLIVFTENLADLDFATYFGGNVTGDHVDGGTSRFDKRGIVYQSVCSSCPSEISPSTRVSDFPTTTGAFSENNPSPRCSNASFKLAMVDYNEKPELEEVVFTTRIADTIKVTVFDSFEFTYKIRDPELDSLYVSFDIPEDLKLDLTEYQEEYAGVGEIEAYFKMLFTCKNAGDTFEIEVYARDVGCPVFNDSAATITIIISEPEKLPPPEVFCLFFSKEDYLKMEWGATPESDYFYRMMLYKISPNGVVSVLDTFYTQDAGIYLDKDVINPREQDYTYYLVVEDICNFLGEPSYLLSSIKESEVPVESTYLVTTTVAGDSILVVFLKSNEQDFGFYEVYKSIRGKSNWEYIESIDDIEDTSYSDGNVDVNTTSYCYRIKVVDDCGHNSAYSNIGCSIVIRGESINEKGVTPRFKFDLWWDDYVAWNGGVREYELRRSVDTGILRPIVRLNNPILEYRDIDLDYNWGGYWYSVVAYENDGSYNATSRSNDIYLIQPPLVFVPNAVTSNGDNLNDSFGWTDVFVREFEMKVYNRWGEKVFETTDKNKRWSSEYKNDEIKYSNVYFWIVTYKGWDNYYHTDKGTVTFLK